MLRHTLVTSLCAAALLAACSTGGMTDPSTIAPTVATAAVPALTTSPPATTASSTSVMTSTEVPSTDVPTVTLSADGPWTRVDGAPGITTAGLVYELMPKLWVYLPTEIDLEHGITWTFNETDRPVIEAYLQAQRTYFVAGMSGVIDDQVWSEFSAEADQADDLMRKRLSNGERLKLDAGVVLRPTVLGEERSDTSAIIFDCTLDGSVYLTSDGDLAKGSVWGVIEIGRGFRLAASDGAWRVTQTGTQPEACL